MGKVKQEIISTSNTNCLFCGNMRIFCGFCSIFVFFLLQVYFDFGMVLFQYRNGRMNESFYSHSYMGALNLLILMTF